MSLLHRLHGARSGCVLRQHRRRSDGVRGMFAATALHGGALIFSVPLHYCFLTHPPLVMTHARTAPCGVFDAAKAAAELRRCNRSVKLCPEAWTWLQRLSPDAAADQVSLTSTISCDAPATSATGAPSVMSLTLSPVEAALATSVALRYLYSTALGLPAATRVTHRIGAAPHDLSDRFVASLPFDVYLRYGVESLYGDASSAEAHLCLEQLTANLRDAVLTHASATEFRFLDEAAPLVDAVLLVSLYLIRSRVLQVSLLSSSPAVPDRRCCVFAPGLDGLNHASLAPTAAVVVSAAQRAVVVRAVRPIARGEEITLDYRRAGGSGSSAGLRGLAAQPRTPEEEREHHMDHDWASRYLMEDAA